MFNLRISLLFIFSSACSAQLGAGGGVSAFPIPQTIIQISSVGQLPVSCSGSIGWLLAPTGVLYTCQNGVPGVSGGVPSPFTIPGPIRLSGPGAGYVTMLHGIPASIATPTSGSRTLFYDSTNGDAISVKLSDGSVVDIQSVPSLSPSFSNATVTLAPGYPTNYACGIVSAICIDMSLSGVSTNPATYGLNIQGTLNPASGSNPVISAINNSPFVNMPAGYGTATLAAMQNAIGSNLTDNGSAIYGNQGTYYDQGPSTLVLMEGDLVTVAKFSGGGVTTGIGIQSDIDIDNAFCTECDGFNSALQPITATIGTFANFKADYSQYSDGSTTVTNLKGAWITSPVGKFGFTNNAGVQIDDQGSGSGHYAIRQIGASNVSQFDGLIGFTGQTLAALGMLTIANGQETYCSDCTVTSGINNTCAGSGSGAFARKINGVLKCEI